MYKRLITVAVLVMLCFAIKAQNLEDIKIPTLHALLDSAYANAPMIGYHTERKAETGQLIKANKLAWTEFIGVENYYRYGRLGITDQNSSTTNLPLPIVSSSQVQNWWYVGAYIRIPLSAFILPFVETKRLRHVERQSEYEIEDIKMELGQKVVEQYNALLLNIEILKDKALLLQTNNAQIEEAENLYKSRKIDLGRVAQLQEMQNKVSTEFATARSEARSALQKLEILTGVTLIE